MKKEPTPKTQKAAYVPPKLDKQQLLKDVLEVAPTLTTHGHAEG
jgi:hypothetical protein